MTLRPGIDLCSDYSGEHKQSIKTWGRRVWPIDAACSGGKFVVSNAGEAYDARDSSLIRKSRLTALNASTRGPGTLLESIFVLEILGDAPRDS